MHHLCNYSKTRSHPTNRSIDSVNCFDDDQLTFTFINFVAYCLNSCASLTYNLCNVAVYL